VAALLDESTAPRSIISLSDARDRVRGDLGLTDSSLLTNANLLAWLNEAQDELARHLRWYRTFDIMGTTSGTKEYALPEPVSGRCIQIEEVRYDNEQLEAITFDALLRYDYNYQQAGTGTPDYYYLRGQSGFGLHVTPGTTDPDILTVVYVGIPPRISADDESFYCPHGGERAILIYAKMMASEKDIYGEGARRAQIYAAQWEQELVRLKRQTDQGAEREGVVLGAEAMDGYPRRRVPFRTTIGQ